MTAVGLVSDNTQLNIKNTPSTANEITVLVFNEDPAGAIVELREFVRVDNQSNAPLSEYLSLEALKSKSQDELNQIAQEIINNYDIRLKLPANKLVLATIRDEIDLYLDESAHSSLKTTPLCVSENFSAEHVLVLLNSINGPRRNHLLGSKGKLAWVPQQNSSQVMPMGIGKSANLAMLNNDAPPPMLSNNIYLGSEGNQVVFRIEEGLVLGPADYNQLNQIHELVAQLNTYIPDRPVSEVFVGTNDGGGYGPVKHFIEINLSDENCLPTMAHELGHALFEVLLSNETHLSSNDSIWQSLYALSLGNHFYEIVDDSNYSAGMLDLSGHPFDNETEFFASSVAAYQMHGDQFVAFITDPDTPAGQREIGKNVFIFLRDNVFGGEVFASSDPFAGESLEGVEFSQENILSALKAAQLDGNLQVQAAAKRMIARLTPNDHFESDQEKEHAKDPL